MPRSLASAAEGWLASQNASNAPAAPVNAALARINAALARIQCGTRTCNPGTRDHECSIRAHEPNCLSCNHLARSHARMRHSPLRMPHSCSPRNCPFSSRIACCQVCKRTPSLVESIICEFALGENVRSGPWQNNPVSALAPANALAPTNAAFVHTNRKCPDRNQFPCS